MLDAVTSVGVDIGGAFGLEIVVIAAFVLAWQITGPVFRKKKSEVPLGKGVSTKGSTKSAQQCTLQVLALCDTQFTRALRVYRDMVRKEQDREIKNEQFYITLIEAAVRVGKNDVTEQIIGRMSEIGMKPSVAFLQSTMKLFVARRYFRECLFAWQVFEPKESDKTVLSCLALAAAELDKKDQAMQFLDRLVNGFHMPNREYIPLFRSLVRQRDWKAAQALIEGLVKGGVVIDNLVFNTALCACTTAPTSAVARGILEKVLEEEKLAVSGTVDTVSFNTVIKCCARNGEVANCFTLFDRLLAMKLQPDDVTFSTLLDVCIDHNEQDLATSTIERMTSNSVEMNCVLMTTLIKGFIRMRRLDKAMGLYHSMLRPEAPVKPDMVTYSILIKAQCDALNMGASIELLEQMLQAGFNPDDFVFTHLIDGCCQASNVELAEKFFNDMRTACVRPTVFTFTSLVKVYGKCGMFEKAMDLVSRMELDYGVKPTVVVYTCLVSGMLRHKKYQQAWEYFQKMLEITNMDNQGAATMIQGMADGRQWDAMLQICKQSLNQTPPLKVHQQVYNHALSQLCSCRQTKMARELYKLMVEKKIPVTVEQISRRLNL